MFVDSHAHLEGRKYDADREDVIARARAAGIEAIVAIGNGEGPADVDCGIRMAERYSHSKSSQVSATERREPGAPSDRGPSTVGPTSDTHGHGYPAIYATIGIHPHEAQLATEEHFARLDELAKHPRVIAWGEMGLDYYYDHSPRDVQQQVFRRQLGQAREAKLPIVIHCRDAWDDCLAIMEQDWKPTGLGGILHCFTGTLAEARSGLDMGFMVSFAGNLTYPKMQHLRDVAKELPMERLLTETDSPFLPPQGKRGKRNEPSFVVEVAQALANVRNSTADEVAATTAANFRRFFRLGAPASPAPPR